MLLYQGFATFYHIISLNSVHRERFQSHYTISIKIIHLKQLAKLIFQILITREEFQKKGSFFTPHSLFCSFYSVISYFLPRQNGVKITKYWEPGIK